MSDKEDYKLAYVICLEKIARVDGTIKDLEIVRSNLRETLADIAHIFKTKYKKDIKEQLNG